jgi:hypothetical protein
MKYFVNGLQYKGSPLLHFQDNTEHILLTLLGFYGNNGYANSAQYNVVVRCPNIVVNCIKNAYWIVYL